MEFHHPFFRAKAMQEYMQREEKDILPRFLSPYSTILSYLLLCLLLLTAFLAWWGEVPLFISGLGVVLTKGAVQTLHTKEKAIVIFLPAKDVASLHAGESVNVFAEPTGQQFTSIIKHVENRVISSDQARRQYMLSGSMAQSIPRVSVAVILLPVTASTSYLETGNIVRFQAHIGSQSILSFCLGLKDW
ncbi:MAG TPA: hypothetical protein VFN35_01850 [Ktedonobacteraceae bacterium]|nr:hypothetical protein [Ktedonobacteraceae bacterium]